MELHEYQRRAANFIHTHPRCILSVDMGLGKTAAVLAWLNYARPARVLIVAPKRVAENQWHTEAEKWGLQWVRDRMVVVAGTARQRAAAIANTERPWKITSRDNVKAFAGTRWDVLVIDELTSFKSVTSARTKAVLSIAADRKIGLTGTFLANGALDIYGQAAAVGLSFNRLNFYAWRATYFRDALAGSGLAFQKWRPVCPLESILQPIIGQIFTLTAADWLTIPPVTETTHAVPLEAEQREAYEDAEAFLGFELQGERLTIEEGAKFAKLQTLCNGFVYAETETGERETKRAAVSAKLERVADLVADYAEAGEQVLLFYAYKGEREWLEEMLRERGVRFDSVERRGFLDRWNAGETPVLFAHPASAGHGLNLQHGGRVCVWSSLTYNYELFAQGNARLARQGQRRQVQIHYFTTADTIEERVVRALVRKQSEQEEFLRLTK